MLRAPTHLNASTAQVKTHPASWEFAINNADSAVSVQRMLVLFRDSLVLKAWPAAAAASCSSAFARATPVPHGDGLHSQASVFQAASTALDKAISSPAANEPVTWSGSIHSSDDDTDSKSFADDLAARGVS